MPLLDELFSGGSSKDGVCIDWIDAEPAADPDSATKSAAFEEDKHPRADDGRFGDKAGEIGAEKPSATKQEPAAAKPATDSAADQDEEEEGDEEEEALNPDDHTPADYGGRVQQVLSKTTKVLEKHGDKAAEHLLDIMPGAEEAIDAVRSVDTDMDSQSVRDHVDALHAAASAVANYFGTATAVDHDQELPEALSPRNVQALEGLHAAGVAARAALAELATHLGEPIELPPEIPPIDEELQALKNQGEHYKQTMASCKVLAKSGKVIADQGEHANFLDLDAVGRALDDAAEEPDGSITLGDRAERLLQVVTEGLECLDPANPSADFLDDTELTSSACAKAGKVIAAVKTSIQTAQTLCAAMARDGVEINNEFLTASTENKDGGLAAHASHAEAMGQLVKDLKPAAKYLDDDHSSDAQEFLDSGDFASAVADAAQDVGEMSINDRADALSRIGTEGRRILADTPPADRADLAEANAATMAQLPETLQQVRQAVQAADQALGGIQQAWGQHLDKGLTQMLGQPVGTGNLALHQHYAEQCSDYTTAAAATQDSLNQIDEGVGEHIGLSSVTDTLEDALADLGDLSWGDRRARAAGVVRACQAVRAADPDPDWGDEDQAEYKKAMASVANVEKAATQFRDGLDRLIQGQEEKKEDKAESEA